MTPVRHYRGNHNANAAINAPCTTVCLRKERYRRLVVPLSLVVALPMRGSIGDGVGCGVAVYIEVLAFPRLMRNRMRNGTRTAFDR